MLINTFSSELVILVECDTDVMLPDSQLVCVNYRFAPKFAVFNSEGGGLLGCS